MVRVWMITGCTSGFGKEIAMSALSRGDKVIATCRGNPYKRLSDLIAKGADVLSLDVTAPVHEIQAFAQTTIEIHGHVDVVCNNAGYLQHGAVEEVSPEETMKQFQTALFGPLNVSRAFLAHMRERKTGAICMIGSGVSALALAGCGTYTAAKAALASLTLALAAEIEPFNIQATCIEPGEYRTDVFTVPTRSTTRIPAYEQVLAPSLEKVNPDFEQPGDPHKAAERIVDLLTGIGLAKGRKVPFRITLGDDAYEWKLMSLEQTEKEVKDWREWTNGTSF